MILLCKCGTRRTVSPFRSAVTKVFICDKCSVRNRVKFAARVVTSMSLTNKLAVLRKAK